MALEAPSAVDDIADRDRGEEAGRPSEVRIHAAGAQRPIDAEVDEARQPAGQRIAHQLPQYLAMFVQNLLHPPGVRPPLALWGGATNARGWAWEEKKTLMPSAGGSPFQLLDRYWRWWLAVLWLLVGGLMLADRWGAIHIFALGDTDDNMRMMQVRALLHGQGWFDLRNYRLNPPFGANIHWSRLVDLPSVTADEKGQGALDARAEAIGLAKADHYLKLTRTAHINAEGRVIDLDSWQALPITGQLAGLDRPLPGVRDRHPDPGPDRVGDGRINGA